MSHHHPSHSHPHATKTIWLVGGGTGGHVVALFPIAEALKKERHMKVVIVGERGGLEAQLAREHELPFLAITAGKLRRYVTLGSFFLTLRDIWRFAAGCITSYRLVKKQRPSLIFSKGGPVALPVTWAAWITGTPFITHESDVVMGMANRLSARVATHILTAFPASYYPLAYAKKITTVGLPLRPEFCHKGEARAHSSRLPTVLVIGGSQGSLALNELLRPNIDEMVHEMNLIHITGQASYESFVALKMGLPLEYRGRYQVFPFTNDIAHLMKQATVVVSRASSTIFEIATLHKPMLLIPLPSAANNHQTKNAEVFVAHQAAIMARQDSLTPDIFYTKLTQLLHDKPLQRRLADGTQAFTSCDATENVVRLIRDTLQ